jgi:hypothetical protein
MVMGWHAAMLGQNPELVPRAMIEIEIPAVGRQGLEP